MRTTTLFHFTYPMLLLMQLSCANPNQIRITAREETLDDTDIEHQANPSPATPPIGGHVGSPPSPTVLPVASPGPATPPSGGPADSPSTTKIDLPDDDTTTQDTDGGSTEGSSVSTDDDYGAILSREEAAELRKQAAEERATRLKEIVRDPSSLVENITKLKLDLQEALSESDAAYFKFFINKLDESDVTAVLQEFGKRFIVSRKSETENPLVTLAKSAKSAIKTSKTDQLVTFMNGVDVGNLKELVNTMTPEKLQEDLAKLSITRNVREEATTTKGRGNRISQFFKSPKSSKKST